MGERTAIVKEESVKKKSKGNSVVELGLRSSRSPSVGIDDPIMDVLDVSFSSPFFIFFIFFSPPLVIRFLTFGFYINK